MKPITLEICCPDILSYEAAIEGGADRVELCTGLAEGGMTPSDGMIRQAVAMPGKPKIHVLIRPRAGDFCYGEREIRIMLDDISRCRDLGVDGVVVGGLNEDSTIDVETSRRLIRQAEGMAVTYHRAFDVCRNPEEAFRIITDLGANRLLTSGGAPKAIEALGQLARLVELSPEGFSVIAASGVNPQNLETILRETGLREAHASASDLVEVPLRYFATDKLTNEYDSRRSSAAIVRQLSTITRNFSR